MFLFCFLTGAFCACQEGQSANTGITPAPVESTGTLSPTPEPTPEAVVTTPPEVTKAPLVTETPENSPTPYVVETAVPIDEAHFTSAGFREFIKEEYDKDSDGFLSGAERGVVKEMWLGDSGYSFKGECLDGFEYFPNLTNLDISDNCQAEQVIIRNHPSLQSFGGSEGGWVRTLQIENCPALTRIGFYIYRIDSLSVSGAPLAVLDLTHTRLDSITLDADMVLYTSDGRTGEQLYTINEDDQFVYLCDSSYYAEQEGVCQQTLVKFTNQKEPQFPFSEEYWTECLENSEFGELERFRVQISEKEEAGYNEKGQKGYAVRVFYTRSNHDYGDKTFVIYADEMPVREQFVFRPAVISRIENVEYSPNRGVCVFTKWDLAFVYRGEEEEQVLDVFDRHEHYCAIAADGAVKAIPASRRWYVQGEYDSLLRFMLTGTASNADLGAWRADSD